MENEMTSRKSIARLAGLLYLFWIISGLFSMYYVTSKINLEGDASAAVQDILSNEILFRTSIVNGLVNCTIWIFMVLIFYRLFKSVNEGQARLLFAFVIVQVPLSIISEAFSITSLMIAKGEVLKTFDLSQKQELSLLFIKINDSVVSALVLFWGLWLFPLGILTYRSRFLPRFLGVWLIIDGVALVVLSIIGLLFPQYKDITFKIAFPAMLGEVAFMLWLLIKGTKNNMQTITNQTAQK